MDEPKIEDLIVPEIPDTPKEETENGDTLEIE